MFKKLNYDNNIKTKNSHSHFNIKLEDIKKKFRLNDFRNSPQEIGSKFISKLLKELQIC